MENDDTHDLPPDVSECIKVWDAYESRQVCKSLVARGGATWQAIGTALRITKQRAQDYYLRQIESQEKHAADFHDAARVRAALNVNDVQ